MDNILINTGDPVKDTLQIIATFIVKRDECGSEISRKENERTALDIEIEQLKQLHDSYQRSIVDILGVSVVKEEYSLPSSLKPMSEDEVSRMNAVSRDYRAFAIAELKLNEEQKAE